MSAKVDLLVAVSQLVSRFGARDVLMAMRDGCDSASDLSDENHDQWRAASEKLEEAAAILGHTDHTDGQPDLGDALGLLADIEPEGN